MGLARHSPLRVSEADSGRKGFCARTARQEDILAQALGFSRAEVHKRVRVVAGGDSPRKQRCRNGREEKGERRKGTLNTLGQSR